MKLTDRIKLTVDDIDIIDVGELRHVRFCSLEGEEIEWTDKDAHQLKLQLLDNLDEADIGARLKEETKILKNYLIKHGKEMPQTSKDVMTLRLLAYEKIIKGDKPDDKSN